jgi:hypothetical protein
MANAAKCINLLIPINLSEYNKTTTQLIKTRNTHKMGAIISIAISDC